MSAGHGSESPTACQVNTNQPTPTSAMRMVRRDAVTKIFESLTICQVAGAKQCKRDIAGLTWNHTPTVRPMKIEL